MPKSYITFNIAQDREIEGICFFNGYFVFSIIYARSAECITAEEIGQDYITICTDDKKLSFALCDGVSQSFFGDAAARFLAKKLAKWLIELPEEKIKDINEELASYLNLITIEATELVNKIIIPNNLPEMMIKVLEKKRKLGSETTFLCGRLDIYQPHANNGQIMLALMGDSQMQIWKDDKEIIKENNIQWSAKGRWSSRNGVKNGEPYFYVNELRDISLIRAYSDGLMLIGEQLEQQITFKDLWEKIKITWTNPASDDISFLQIEILKEPLHGIEQLSAPAKKNLDNDDRIYSEKWSRIYSGTIEKIHKIIEKPIKNLKRLKSHFMENENMIKYNDSSNMKETSISEIENQENMYQFTLTGAELYYLSEIFNAPAILGVQNPFLGLLADEIDIEREKTKKSMIEKRYITEINQQIIIDALLGIIIDALLFPDIFVILNLSMQEAYEQVFFYKNDNFIIKLNALSPQTPAYIAQIEYNIIASQELINFPSMILHVLRIKEASGINSGLFIIDKEILEEMVKIICKEGIENAIDFLEQKNIDHLAMDDFLNDLTSRVRNFSLSVIKRKSSQQSEYYDLAILEGKNWYWKLQPLEIYHNKIGITSVASQDIIKWIESVTSF